VIDMPNWQSTTGSAIWRRHAGDIEGAIADMVKAVEMTRPIRELAKETAVNLNYLADLYLVAGAGDRAEEALRESIELARPRYPLLLADNLLILGRLQARQGKSREALASAEESIRICQREKHDHGAGQAEQLIQEIRRPV
jgi:tetratricopeptide (TPR) repeat protein